MPLARLTLGLGLAAVFVVGLALTFAPQLDISRLPLLAGVVGARNAVTAATGCTALISFLAALLWRRRRTPLLSLAGILVVLTVLSGLIVLGHGTGNDTPAQVAEGRLRILSWNINGDLVTAQQIADEAAAAQASVIVLPEISQQEEHELVTLLPQFHVHPDAPTSDQQTFVFTAAALGDFTQAPASGPDAVKETVLTPTDPALPRIVALHAAQPTLRSNPTWNATLDWVAHECTTPGTVVVGDFNATVDTFGVSSRATPAPTDVTNAVGPPAPATPEPAALATPVPARAADPATLATPGLGPCADAAALRGAASTGTWPTLLPPALGMPLDHVLVTADWHVDSFTALTDADHSGARHRPILVVISPASSGRQ